MSAESFTVLAILEARDKASEIFRKVDESLVKFGDSAKGAAESAAGAGAKIDESLLKTASGADALDVASAKVDAAQARTAAAAREQAAAERELLAAQQAAAGAADGDAAAQDRLLAASKGLAAAQKESAASAKELSGAEKLQSDTAAAAAAKNDAAAAGQRKVSDSAKAGAVSLGTMGRAAGVTAIGLGVAGAVMVKAAGNFQDSTTHLVTDAGESAKNLSMVQAGILRISTATGTSAGEITNAMYHIESAGYHGAAGLKLLKVAAEGARVGGASLDTVSKTLVGTMNAYGMSADKSASFMNALIATVGAGDMKMQDLASSLSNVAPLAASLHISFAQVGGAIATMTAQGMSAQQATQDLANTMRGLSNPNATAIAEMNQLGINAQDVSQHLGQRGLTGTIGMLTRAITSHMGASGKVIMSAFTQSTTAGADLQAMLKTMPPQFQKLAHGFMSGSVSAKQWRTEMRAQTPVNQHLMGQFAALYTKSHSFNALLAKGGPAAQTYTAALAKMTGGATGLNTSLMLTGGHMATFKGSVDKVGNALSGHAKDVENWSTIQGTFNYKLSAAKTAVENTGIAIGTALLPAATSLLKTVTSIVQPVAAWTADHRKLTAVLFGGIAAIAGTIAVVAGMRKAYQAVTGTISTVRSGLKLLGGLAKLTAGKQAAGAAEAAAADSAAAGESAAAWTAANIAMTAGIVLVVAAVVAAVYLIVTHWRQVSHAVAAVWDWVYSHVTGIIGKIVSWVKGHWPLLVGIITGPLGLAVVEVIKHWDQIKAFISRVVGDVVGWVKSHWMLLVGIVTGPLGLVVGEVVRHWNQIRRDTVRFAGDVVRTVSRLAGDAVRWFTQMFSLLAGVEARGIGTVVHWFANGVSIILGILRNLAGEVVSVGADIVRGLWNGISQMGGWLWNQVQGFAGNVVNSIKSALGIGSPSRITAYHGRMLGEGLAQGILASTGRVAAASRVMAAAALAPASSLAAGGSAQATGSALAASAVLPAVSPGGGRGATYVTIDMRDAHVMSDHDITLLTDRIGQALNTILPSAGHHVRG